MQKLLAETVLLVSASKVTYGMWSHKHALLLATLMMLRVLNAIKVLQIRL
jgi:hypothetical protein